MTFWSVFTFDVGTVLTNLKWRARDSITAVPVRRPLADRRSRRLVTRRSPLDAALPFPCGQ
ncbi:hypothetical protein J6590_012925 [Homalodisca vitripennis]|nr:hypothetical protein J6590_012925 [Homalodisca vitripennis]